MKDLEFVCVMDSGALWEFRVLNLLRSLRLFGGRYRDHHFRAVQIGSPRVQFAAALAELGGELDSCSPPVPGRPFMNKVAALRQDRSAGLVVLDCDTVVVADLDGLDCRDDEVRFKAADADPFHIEDWLALELALGELRLRSLRTTTTEALTALYPNSGVLLVGTSIRAEVMSLWLAKFAVADRLLSRRFPSKAFYAEQVALGAAVAASAADFRALPVEFNWPAHLVAEAEPSRTMTAPRIVHYHNMCDGARVVAPLAPSKVQQRLDHLSGLLGGDIVDRTRPSDLSLTGVLARSHRLKARSDREQT